MDDDGSSPVGELFAVSDPAKGLQMARQCRMNVDRLRLSPVMPGVFGIKNSAAIEAVLRYCQSLRNH